MLRIHLFLMRIRIRILDPHWKKMDPDPNPDPGLDPGHFYKIYWIIIFKFFVLFFSHIFILQLDEPFRNEEIFIISLFFKVHILDLEVKKVFFLQFFGWYFAPWIRIRGSAYFPGSQNLADPTDSDPDPDPNPKHWLKPNINSTWHPRVQIYPFLQQRDTA